MLSEMKGVAPMIYLLCSEEHSDALTLVAAPRRQPITAAL